MRSFWKTGKWAVTVGVMVAAAAPAFAEHVHLQRGELRGAGGGPHNNPLITYHQGSVIKASKTKAIFWGSEWNDTKFAGDKITGMDSFFGGYSGSHFATTTNEYYDATGAHITSTSTYLGSVIDSSPAPPKAITTGTAVAEACAIAGQNPDPDAIYFIFTSTGAGHVTYCAWHSWGNCPNGLPVQVAYMPNIDGIGGCDPKDTSGLHSQGLAALANVTSHELSEAITDPRGAGWFDNGNQENGDKCAWSFGPALEIFTNGSDWKLQMEWSNAAYSNGTGLPNLSGQAGCIY